MVLGQFDSAPVLCDNEVTLIMELKMETILIPIKRLFAGYYTNAVLFSADGRVIRGSLRIFAHDCVKFWSLLINKDTHREVKS